MTVEFPESNLIDHTDGTKIFNEILNKENPRVACNIIAYLKDLQITLSQMQNDITQMKVNIQTLEELVK